MILFHPSPGSKISGSPDRQERRDENHSQKKDHITFFQKTVGYRDAIKLLMVVFGQSLQDVRWKMLSKGKYLGDITSATDI